MINLNGQHLSKLPVSGLVKVRDLDYFDGPLLVHFRHERGDHYLQYWCDCDQNVNRWMLLRVNETSIIRVLNRYIPLDQVVPTACQDDFVYFLDIGENGKLLSTILVQKEQIPQEYTPTPGCYLDADVCRDDRSYPVLLEGSLSLEQIYEIPTRYTQAYSLLYTLQVLKPEAFVELPWRGGFSSMHFYRLLANIVPGEHRPEIVAFQYASPGFIRFVLHRPTADAVAERVILFSNRKSPANQTSASLRSYITGNNLNDLRDTDPNPSSEIWEKHNPELLSRTKALLAAMNISEADAFISALRAPFEAAKITQSLAIRLRDLAKLVEDGIIRFPTLSS